MPISNSTILLDSPQVGGSRRVLERHVDHLGVARTVTYICTAGFDAAAALAANATAMATDIAVAEIAANIAAIATIGSLAVSALNHSTLAANIASLRAAYQGASEHHAAYIGDYLSARTDAQLQAAFGMTSAQVSALRSSKLTTAANAAASLRSMTGA